jgi:hypothetical protein
MRGGEFSLLDLGQVQGRLVAAPEGQITHPETGIWRRLYDGSALALTPTGGCSRLIVATHPAPVRPRPLGTTPDGLVYQRCFSSLPPSALRSAAVVHLYLHRASFESVLADPDQDQEPDRWC